MALETRPARYMGRVRANELDFEMIVLARSKKAASIGCMVGQERVASDRQNRPGGWFGPRRVGYYRPGAETHSPPCAFSRLLFHPPGGAVCLLYCPDYPLCIN